MVQSVKEELVKVVQILWRAHTCPSCHNLNTICLHPALIDFPLALFRFLFPLFPFTLFIFFPSLFSSLCSPFHLSLSLFRSNPCCLSHSLRGGSIAVRRLCITETSLFPEHTLRPRLKCKVQAARDRLAALSDKKRGREEKKTGPD